MEINRAWCPFPALPTLPTFLACLLPSIGGPLLAQSTTFDFAAPELIELPAGFAPTCLDLGDLDQDGVTDLVVCGRGQEGGVLVLPGLGNGSLGPPTDLGLEQPIDWLELGDLDEDGILDLVLAARSRSGRLELLRGLAGGGFAETSLALRFGRELRSARLADLDGDTHLDLVVVGHASDEVRILVGDGTGGFQTARRLRCGSWKNGYAYPQSVQLPDLDGDGRLDLTSVGIGTRSLEIAINDGSATFPEARSWVGPVLDNGTIPGCSYGAWADFNGDGRLECLLTLTSFGSQQFAVIEVDEAGDVAGTTLHAGSLTGISWFPEVGDFDGDGDPDVVIGHALPGLISFFENVTTPGGPPAFLAPQSFPASEFTRFLRTVDLDLDGDLDLLAADFTGDRLVILRNNRLGGASPRSPDQPTPALRDPASVVPPELRTDGVALAKWLSDLDGDPTRIVLDPGDDPVTGAPR